MEIILGGNFLGGNCPGGSYPGWEFSKWELSWVGIFFGGSFPGGSFHVTITCKSGKISERKVSCIKRANKLNQYKQNSSFQREKEHVQRFIISL